MAKGRGAIRPQSEKSTSPESAVRDLQESIGQSVGRSETLENILAKQPITEEEYFQQYPDEPRVSDIIDDEPQPDLVAEKLKLQIDEDAAQNPDRYMRSLMEADRNLYERGAGALLEEERGLDTRRYAFKGPQLEDGPVAEAVARANDSGSADGGIFERADIFAETILDPNAPIGVVSLLHPKYATKAMPVLDPKETSNVAKLMSTIKAIKTDPNSGQTLIDSEFLRMASLVTEDLIADQTMNESRIEQRKIDTAISGDIGDGFDVANLPKEGESSTMPLSITKAQQNKTLGDRLLKEWSKISRQDLRNVGSREKEFLGDVMKELYYEINKGSPEARNIKRVQVGDQVVFQVTGHGQDMFRSSQKIRKLFFPKEHVDALDAPRMAKPKDISVRGSKKKGKLVDQDLITAVNVLESIPHYVIPRREKILLSALLSALANPDNSTDPLIQMAKQICGFGQDKVTQFKAKAVLAQRSSDKRYFNVQENMDILKRNIAQTLYGIAKHRGTPVYLTYFIQAFNGRLTPEQTHFNPTSNKLIRFVTGNPKPVSIYPGKNSREEKNLREMYSMMMVQFEGKEAGDMLYQQRKEMFDRAYPNLVKFGGILKGALDNTNVDPVKVAEAVLQGVPLDNPDFPQFEMLKIPPEESLLIQRIFKKGEDGLALIDGLIDVYEYDRVLQHNKNNPDQLQQFHTHYNAYIDGKTNGLASNGQQLGIESTAERTGVLRTAESIYAVGDDNRDMRDVLADALVTQLEDQRFKERLKENMGDDSTSLTSIAYVLFTTRALNKATTMTFGYGKELNSFKKDLHDFTILKYQESKELLAKKGEDGKYTESEMALVKFHQHVDYLAASPKFLEGAPMGVSTTEEAIAHYLLDIYADKLIEVITPDGIKARKTMYNAAMLHVMMDELIEMEGPTGFPLYYGGLVSTGAKVKRGAIEGEGISYGITTDLDEDGFPLENSRKRSVTAQSYGLRGTASAVRETIQGGKVQQYIGGDALGASNPGPVQAIDAATVVMSVIGDSYRKLDVASKGSPYIHTIYDAFKADANGFDVVVNEVNTNWYNINKQYSYLKEMRESYKNALERFNKRLDNYPKNQFIDIKNSGLKKIGEFLDGYEDKETGKIIRPSLKSFIKRNLPRSADDGDVAYKVQTVINKLIKTKVLIDADDIPTRLKPAQIKLFIRILKEHMYEEDGGFDRSLDKFIEHTDSQRAILFNKIDKQVREGRLIAQYYAH